MAIFRVISVDAFADMPIDLEKKSIAFADSAPPTPIFSNITMFISESGKESLIFPCFGIYVVSSLSIQE